VVQGDAAVLFNDRALVPYGTHIHPTDDHFLPLFFAPSVSGWGGLNPIAVHYLSREAMYGMLPMDVFALG
jgi:4,5-DOPA dioxygenase extradiol